MGEVSFRTSAYAKIILHATKYPHYAVNGILLADASKIKEGSKHQELDIVDVFPLFHHSHYVSPMSEVALTQIENLASEDNRIIAGYYAACENFHHNTVDKCPGQRIAEKIVDYFPSAIFVVLDNKKVTKDMDSPAIKIFKYSEGKWKPKENSKIQFQAPHVLKTVSHLLQRDVQKALVDFDDYLDNITQDWSNRAIDKLTASMDASNMLGKDTLER